MRGSWKRGVMLLTLGVAALAIAGDVEGSIFGRRRRNRGNVYSTGSYNAGYTYGNYGGASAGVGVSAPGVDVDGASVNAPGVGVNAGVNAAGVGGAQVRGQSPEGNNNDRSALPRRDDSYTPPPAP